MIKSYHKAHDLQATWASAKIKCCLGHIYPREQWRKYGDSSPESAPPSGPASHHCLRYDHVHKQTLFVVAPPLQGYALGLGLAPQLCPSYSTASTIADPAPSGLPTRPSSSPATPQPRLLLPSLFERALLSLAAGPSAPLDG